MQRPSDLSDEPEAAQSAAAIAAEYARLQKRLTELNSAPVRDNKEIDRVIASLAKTQLAFKATHGLIGNNPVDDR